MIDFLTFAFVTIAVVVCLALAIDYFAGDE